MSNENRLVAGGWLTQKLTTNTGKSWPLPSRIIGSGTNGIAFGLSDPSKILKISVGNATREVNALKKLLAAGANFVPSVNGNFVNIRKNVNNKIKRPLFPFTYSRFNSPETKTRKETISSYIMQKVGNMSLWTYAKTRPVSNENKVRIRSEIARIIKFMHAHGISHGDLHSGNILVELTADGKVKKLWVIDFGRYVNIPLGKREKEVYNTLRQAAIHNNYNLFNSTHKPRTTLYNGPTGRARSNRNLYREMYGGKNNNLA